MLIYYVGERGLMLVTRDLCRLNTSTELPKGRKETCSLQYLTNWATRTDPLAIILLVIEYSRDYYPQTRSTQSAPKLKVHVSVFDLSSSSLGLRPTIPCQRLSLCLHRMQQHFSSRPGFFSIFALPQSYPGCLLHVHAQA